jgi:FKBP-type peptidyl-prolyl cis-trans isomerase
MFKDALMTLGMGLGMFANEPPLAFPAEELITGTGAPVAVGQRVTVNFLVTDESGAELANSRKRGLPFSFLLENSDTDLFCQLVGGMRVGGQRRVRVPSESAFGPAGLPPIVPGNASLVVVVTVVKATDR